MKKILENDVQTNQAVEFKSEFTQSKVNQIYQEHVCRLSSSVLLQIKL